MTQPWEDLAGLLQEPETTGSEDFVRTTPDQGLDFGTRVTQQPTTVERTGWAGAGGVAGGVAGGLLGFGGQLAARALLDHRARRSPWGMLRFGFSHPRIARLAGQGITSPLVPLAAGLLGSGVGAAAAWQKAPSEQEQVVWGHMNAGGEMKTSMMPSANPAMGAAALAIEPTGPSVELETIAEADRAERDARMASLFAQTARKEMLADLHRKRQLQAAQEHEAMMALMADNVARSRMETDLARLSRSQDPLEQDLLSALGLSGMEAEEADPMETPMKSSAVTDAALIGMQASEDSPLQETYLETTTPNLWDRAARAGLGGVAGGLGGAAVGFGASKLLPKIAPKRFGRLGNLPTGIGTGFGLLGGLLLGGLSNRGVVRGYDTATGDQVGMLDEMRAEQILEDLAPGKQPGNFAVGGPQDAGGLLGLGKGPVASYGVDLDEAVAEDPLLQEALMMDGMGMGLHQAKQSSPRDAWRRLGQQLGMAPKGNPWKRGLAGGALAAGALPAAGAAVVGGNVLYNWDEVQEMLDGRNGFLDALTTDSVADQASLYPYQQYVGSRDAAVVPGIVPKSSAPRGLQRIGQMLGMHDPHRNSKMLLGATGGASAVPLLGGAAALGVGAYGLHQAGPWLDQVLDGDLLAGLNPMYGARDGQDIGDNGYASSVTAAPAVAGAMDYYGDADWNRGTAGPSRW